MIIANNSSFSDGKWVPYVSAKSWILTPPEGNKTVYFKFKDKAENESSIYEAIIIWDKTAPSNPVITINDGQETTNKNTVNLTLSADGADFMMISNGGGFKGRKWESYAESKSGWLLNGADGPKKIFVKFKDHANNISKPIFATINYDKTPPRGTIKISSGAKWTKTPNVELLLTSNGATEMMISTSAGPVWEPYSATKSWTLDEGDGEKTLRVRLKDAAGNTSILPIQAKILLKTNPPQGSKMVIDNNHKYTKNREKRVALKIISHGATEMMISNSADFSKAIWMKYAASKGAWILSGEDGEKTVYIKFRDQAHNESEAISDVIILDRTPPEISSFTINDGEKGTNKPSVSLQIKATEVKHMIISGTPNFGATNWLLYEENRDFKLTGADGIKLVYLKLKDDAGNETKLQKTSIKLDKTPPSHGHIKINNGVEWAINHEITLNIAIIGAAEMMISNSPDFSNATWEKFSKTKKWKLEGEDGLKMVGIKFKDDAGNISTPAVGKIKLSTKPPTNCKILVNGGKEATNAKDKKVKLMLKASGAHEMMIGNDEAFTSSRWEKILPTKLWILQGNDGEKTIYVKFKSGAGTESEVLSQSLILDRTAPTGKITINNGGTGTNDKEGKITLSIETDDAKSIFISNKIDFSKGSWEDYSATKDWNLIGADGIKTVYIKFRDNHHNTSKPTSARIKLDRIPPSGKIKLSGGGNASITSDVTLIIIAKTATEMMLSNSESFSGADWQPFAKNLDWTLSPDDGSKMIYAKFKDASGNESTPTNLAVSLDSKAPTNISVIINDGAEYCTHKQNVVSLKITGEGGVQMMISNAPDFKGALWEPFKEIRKNWHLITGDGDRKVFVKLKDEAGNISELGEDGIMVDISPPSAGKINIDHGKKFTNDKEGHVELTIHSSDDAVEMLITNTKDMAGAEWEPYAKTKQWSLITGDGVKTVYIKFRDKAGNVSFGVHHSITEDTHF